MFPRSSISGTVTCLRLFTSCRHLCYCQAEAAKDGRVCSCRCSSLCPVYARNTDADVRHRPQVAATATLISRLKEQSFRRWSYDVRGVVVFLTRNSIESLTLTAFATGVLARASHEEKQVAGVVSGEMDRCPLATPCYRRQMCGRRWKATDHECATNCSLAMPNSKAFSTEHVPRKFGGARRYEHRTSLARASLTGFPPHSVLQPRPVRVPSAPNATPWFCTTICTVRLWTVARSG